MFTLTKVHGVKTKKNVPKKRSVFVLGSNLRRDIGHFERYSVGFLIPAIENISK
jgi:hypothetical protein